MKKKIYSKIHKLKSAADAHEKKIKKLGGTIIRRINHDDKEQILIQYHF